MSMTRAQRIAAAKARPLYWLGGTEVRCVEHAAGSKRKVAIADALNYRLACKVCGLRAGDTPKGNP